MSKREIAAIIALMIAGFVAYEVISQFRGVDPDEVTPGELPDVAGDAVSDTPAGDMKAVVSASLATEIHAAMWEEHGLPELPDAAGMLAVVGNPGEFFYTTNREGEARVWVMRAAGPEILWETNTDQILEIVGSHGSELLLKFIDEPFAGPADAWQPGGFYGLDMFAAGVGVYPSHLDDETVAMIRSTIR